MFKSNAQEDKVPQEALNSNNIIGKGSTFSGNIQTYGNIRVEGRIVGDVVSKSKVAIGTRENLLKLGASFTLSKP